MKYSGFFNSASSLKAIGTPFELILNKRTSYLWKLQIKDLAKTYRVFMKHCVFFQEFSKVCHLSLASTWLLLVVHKLQANTIGATGHWHCVENFERLLLRCRRGRGCNELWINTIFNEHPVYIGKITHIWAMHIINNFLIPVFVCKLSSLSAYL